MALLILGERRLYKAASSFGSIVTGALTLMIGFSCREVQSEARPVSKRYVKCE
jgi:hypothetical protein